jgi:hypothetical protein
MKDFFFCICDCSSIEWIENVKLTNSRKPKDTVERVNWLTKEGEQKYPWRIDIHLYNVFSKMNIKEKRFQNKWISYDYEDLICNSCENRLQPIPFKDIDKKMRISIFNMSPEERINFAQNYKMLKVIEK